MENLAQAANMVARRGRAYHTNRGRSVQLQVYSTSELDMRSLVGAFGGNYGRHQRGYQWYMSDKASLTKVARIARAYCYGNSFKRLGPLFELERVMPVDAVTTLSALAG